MFSSGRGCYPNFCSSFYVILGLFFQNCQRIRVSARNFYFKMKMRSGRKTSCSDSAYWCSCRNIFSFFNRYFFHVGIKGTYSAGMFYFDTVSEDRIIGFCRNYCSRLAAFDDRTFFCGKVNSPGIILRPLMGLFLIPYSEETVYFSSGKTIPSERKKPVLKDSVFLLSEKKFFLSRE